jgi:excisionase family DNA binding protein
VLVLDGVEMLDVREVARIVERTPETVRRWIWSGRLSATQHGRRLLVARRDVESLLAADTEPAQPSLAGWADSVARQRQSGLLGAGSTIPTAADLVLEDRDRRQAG